MKLSKHDLPTGYEPTWWAKSIKETKLAIENQQIVNQSISGTCKACGNFAPELRDGFCNEKHCQQGRRLLSIIDNGGHIENPVLPGKELSITFFDKQTNTMVTKNITNLSEHTVYKSRRQLPIHKPERPPRRYAK